VFICMATQASGRNRGGRGNLSHSSRSSGVNSLDPDKTPRSMFMFLLVSLSAGYMSVLTFDPSELGVMVRVSGGLTECLLRDRCHAV
jgi:hypothetical protein